ncbi:OmpA family protein [Psychrobacter sp. I-STPA6b]|uniref:OmpA family protein n=1 Tax=Psychrobacter sp. I-STPA6b TaxID=2585718 RepID=UPI001D0C0CB5|nr:OmpA family protein [Psychrobacter sp. I-STPA6b]
MIHNIQLKSSVRHLAIALSCMSMLVSVGCTHTVSSNISRDGHVAVSDLVFPDQNKAWRNQGTFPNRENLSNIRAGMNKDVIYQLIGPPHFSEAQHAQEWDYILNFNQTDGTVKTCQYKIIFDKDFYAQEFYWQPQDCAEFTEIQPQLIQVQEQPIQSNISVLAPHTPIINERINLSADTLFQFNKWRTNDMTSQGRQSLDNLATKLKHYQVQGDSRIIITGYTDRLGDDVYNLNLSQLRAQTVREYLITQGIDPSSMVASGAGESQPVVHCSNTLSRQTLINCLQPNRRVEVAVTVYTPQN